jgi:hypothetical protein
VTVSDRSSRVGPCPPTRRSWPPDPPRAAGHGRRSPPGGCRGLHRLDGGQLSPPSPQHPADPTPKERMGGPGSAALTAWRCGRSAQRAWRTRACPATRQNPTRCTSCGSVSEPRTDLGDAVPPATERRPKVEHENDRGLRRSIKGRAHVEASAFGSSRVSGLLRSESRRLSGSEDRQASQRRLLPSGEVLLHDLGGDAALLRNSDASPFRPHSHLSGRWRRLRLGTRRSLGSRRSFSCCGLPFRGLRLLSSLPLRPRSGSAE